MKLASIGVALMTLDENAPTWTAVVALEDWPALHSKLEIGGGEYVAGLVRDQERVAVAADVALDVPGASGPGPARSGGCLLFVACVRVLACSEGWATRAANAEELSLGVGLPDGPADEETGTAG